MKIIRQKFHQEIRNNQRNRLFCHIRKQLHESQQFKRMYEYAFENNQNLNILITKIGTQIFYKYISQFIDERLYKKLYQNQSYFIQNLNFIYSLIQNEILPSQKIYLIIACIQKVLYNHQNKIHNSTLNVIFNILEQIVNLNKYSFMGLCQIDNSKLIKRLYDIILAKEAHQYFYRIILMYKIIGNPKITHISNYQLINCLQLHILISTNTDQLFLSYGLLGQVFSLVYDKTSELQQYGSILNKTFQDIFIDGLLDPIAYFLLRIIQNSTILKLIAQMNLDKILIEFIIKKICRRNYYSIYSQQSIWFILRKLLQCTNLNDLQFFLNRITIEHKNQNLNNNLNKIQKNYNLSRFNHQIYQIQKLKPQLYQIIKQYLNN